MFDKLYVLITLSFFLFNSGCHDFSVSRVLANIYNSRTYFWYNSFAFFLYFSSYSYCDSDSCRFFSHLKVIAIGFPFMLLFAIAFKSDNYRYYDSWKSHESMIKPNNKKGVTSDNFCYRKVVRAITK